MKIRNWWHQQKKEFFEEVAKVQWRIFDTLVTQIKTTERVLLTSGDRHMTELSDNIAALGTSLQSFIADATGDLTAAITQLSAAIAASNAGEPVGSELSAVATLLASVQAAHASINTAAAALNPAPTATPDPTAAATTTTETAPVTDAGSTPSA